MKIAPKYIFIATWLVLVVLLFSMTALSYFISNTAGWAAILVLAIIQMLLVLSFFMRLRHSSKVVRICSAAGFLWLMIMIVITLSDYLTRQWH
ncbi:MAG TPA: cytochrome C oxidase subunit IV family protein [Verrucomicrobiae bacterium]|jgi:cytochrome c oxidase subunit 4